MAVATKNGEYKVASARESYFVDPRGILVDWSKNLSRGGVRPKIDADLKGLGRSMLSEDGGGGQLEPILCQPDEDGEPKVVVGYRRLAAALWLVESGEAPDFKVRFELIDSMSDSELAFTNIEENIQRLDLEPIQLAKAVKSLGDEYDMSMTAIAKRLRKSANWLRQVVEVLDLPEEIQREVEEGNTSINAAIELTKVAPEDRKAVHREAKTHKGKVKAAAVKAAAAERGSAGPKPRTTNHLRIWLDQRTAAGEPKPSKTFAKAFLNFLDGKPKSEERLAETWDRMFAEVAVEA